MLLHEFVNYYLFIYFRYKVFVYNFSYIYFSCKISEGVTMEKILDDIRDNVHDILKVQTLITKKDL